MAQKEEFSALSKDQKIELRAWQTTVDGRNATKGAKESYFQSKGDSQRKSTDSENNKTKKLKCQIAALQKKVDNQEQLAKIASALKDTKSTRSYTTKTDEESLNIARKVMNIVAREKISPDE